MQSGDSQCFRGTVTSIFKSEAKPAACFMLLSSIHDMSDDATHYVALYPIRQKFSLTPKTISVYDLSGSKVLNILHGSG
jgi:hypothetical protein